ncbi:MAG: Rv2231c family pyridoxal phosphate-dependent protein CobC, partial [Propionicimonas sp.]
IHAVELSGLTPLRGELATAIADGLPTVAECAGQLYLGRHLDGHPMVGAIPATARMTPRLTLGYRAATAAADTLVAAAGTAVTGHEFHRTHTLPATTTPAWAWDGRTEGFSLSPGGGSPSLHSSYLHVHWAGHPGLAESFADAAGRFAGGSGGRAPVLAATDGIDLRHHGDRDLAPGLVDLAVNVRSTRPPQWLAGEITRLTRPLGAYPDAGAARAAIAARHGVDPAMVLPTSGGAEAFSLIARSLPMAHPMVVHPQFTEPELALRSAGAAVQRWLLPVTTGAGAPALGDLPAWADAVFVGNPTNPTGWLHPRAALLAAGQGRLLVVDEAFMDATDETESLIEDSMPGRLVLRSLSKTWGLAGLRVGYVVGDPALLERLEHAQPPWSVSSPAVAAMIATGTPRALAEAASGYAGLVSRRERFAADLAAAGFPTVASSAPFLLVDTSACGPASVRPALAAAGYAVRRGETFPGLGTTWIRVRVPDSWDGFVAALAALRAPVSAG